MDIQAIYETKVAEVWNAGAQNWEDFIFWRKSVNARVNLQKILKRYKVPNVIFI